MGCARTGRLWPACGAPAASHRHYLKGGAKSTRRIQHLVRPLIFHSHDQNKPVRRTSSNYDVFKPSGAPPRLILQDPLRRPSARHAMRWARRMAPWSSPASTRWSILPPDHHRQGAVTAGYDDPDPACVGRQDGLRSIVPYSSHANLPLASKHFASFCPYACATFVAASWAATLILASIRS